MNKAHIGPQTVDPIEDACRELATAADTDKFFCKDGKLEKITHAEVEFGNLYVFVGVTRHLVTAKDNAKEIIKDVLRRANKLNDAT